MRRKIIPYDPKLKEVARKLRKESTLSEIMLWDNLKRGQMKGYDFHRQKPLGSFVVDLFCNELNLAIEIDGESHIGKEEKDYARQKAIEKYKVHFLRFDDLDVRYKLDWVLKEIEKWIDEFEKSNKVN